MRKLTPLRVVGAVLRTLNPKVKTVSHKELGGTARLDSLRPEPHRGIAGGARWLGYAIIFPGTLCWIAVTSPEASPPWLELSLVALMLLGSRFVVRQAKESTSGLLGHSWRTVQDRGFLAAALALITLTLIIRLLAAGLPSSIDGMFYTVGSYLFLASCVAGLYGSWALARSFVRVRGDEYARMHEWGNPVSGKLKAAVGLPITSPEMHSMVHFEFDQVIIDPVPPFIAERFSGIELAMARAHVDDVMLSEDSTPQRICFVPITPEWLERRKLLRSSDFTLLGFDERAIEDVEILGRNVIVGPDTVNPDASKPAKPRAASAAEHISEKDFGQIQRFAMDATDSMTIVGYDLNRYNSDTRRYEKLIYVQRVTAEEKVILERIANLLKPKIWEMWLEFHWVPNAEDDRGEYPQRIDTVVVKRSPVGGLTPEKREQIWRPVIAMMPKGSNGWMIEDDQQTGFVTLRYGKKLQLPSTISYDWDIPLAYRAIPFAVSEREELLSLGALESNILFGGTPGSGKSGGITAYLAGISRLPNVAIVGLDPKRVEQSMWASRFSRIAKDPDSALDVLERLNEEMQRRYIWLEGQELKKLTELHLDVFPLIVLIIDELADLVASGLTKEEKDDDGLRIKLIRRLIALGRASGIVVIAATQKPQSSVIPTEIRDLIQQRVAYATTNSQMTDTILGQGMASNGAAANEIAPNEKGVCYVVNESSRVPVKALTFWIPDEEVKPLAERTAHFRVQLDWLDAESARSDLGSIPPPSAPILPALPLARLSKLVELFGE